MNLGRWTAEGGCPHMGSYDFRDAFGAAGEDASGTAAGTLRLRSRAGSGATALGAAFGRAVRKILHLAEVSGVG
jgi:hypothetical protein